MTSRLGTTAAEREGSGALGLARDRGDHFRPDLQGLRAIAVLLVVAFHAELPLPGGYIGVDVFFALSGFVIARSLLRSSDVSARISLTDFWSRRVRRLLPALATMTVVVLVCSVFVLSPDGSQQAAANTAAAASLSLSNIQLWLTAGSYFSPRLESNPFLHTWSLGVEEQFYLIMPVLFAAVLWMARRTTIGSRRLAATAFGAVGVISLTCSVVLTAGVPLVPDPGRFAFFGPLTRIWEFAAGVLLAVHLPRAMRTAFYTSIGIVGAIALLAAAVVFDASTAFPGLAALVPVGATLALIVAGMGSPTVNTAMSWRPLRTIGDISYSWYLWHWPMIVFARIVWPGNQAMLLVAAAVSLAPAALSHQGLERRFRVRRDIIGWRAAGLAGCCVVVPLLLAVSVKVTANRTAWGLDGVGEHSLAHQQGCLNMGAFIEWPEDECSLRSGAPGGTVLLLGDSHAASISDGVNRAAEENGMALAVWTRAGCPAHGYRAVEEDACEAWQQSATELIETLEPSVVVLAHNTPFYMELSAEPPGQTHDNRATSPERGWLDALDATLEVVREQGALPVVVATVPVFDQPPAPSLVRPGGQELRLSRDEAEERRGSAVIGEQLLVESYGGAFYDPMSKLCAEACTNHRDGRPAYSDDDHITRSTSLLLAESLTQVIREVSERARGPNE